jgi:hypothetical protein
MLVCTSRAIQLRIADLRKRNQFYIAYRYSLPVMNRLAFAAFRPGPTGEISSDLRDLAHGVQIEPVLQQAGSVE